PKKFGSSSVKDISYETLKPSATDNGIDSVVAVERKSSISTRSSDGLNHKGWNQVVIHQFKVIKQKIKHAIVELKKSGHNKASPEYSIIDNEKEISQNIDDGAIHEYKKSKSLSETKAFESSSNKHEPRLMRRTSSLNESMDRYTQLFEKSLSKEVKWQSSKSKSLRLTNDDKTQKSRHARMFSRSNLSMPNLEALGFILHEALLETNDMGNNTVESDNDVQSKSASLPLKNDESTDHFKEAEIDETVEGSGRDVNPSP
ncbi:GTP-binding protein Obg/CgtA protein, partial [Trifolium medium]|nr:GTP-binding protein Obg/CgtA protein [Trifolium medium]